MQNRPFRIRSALIAVVALFIGWQINDAYKFCAETLRKAELCNSIDCDKLSDASHAITASKLPILK